MSNQILPLDTNLGAFNLANFTPFGKIFIFGKTSLRNVSMSSITQQKPPVLRSMIDVQPISYGNQPYLLVRDLLELSEQTLLVPQPLAPVLAWCDGSHGLAEIQRRLRLEYGVQISLAEIQGLLQAMDEALLLENERFEAAWDTALAAYQQAPYRPMSCAPHVYPAGSAELKNLLNTYLKQVEASSNGAVVASDIRGVISPHIDYPRGGRVYAQVWQMAREAAQEAELAVIFGTDHYGGFDRFTLTRQDYATPYGRLPTDQPAVTQLAEAIGSEAAFGGEIRHRVEHSIELAAVWLHHMRAGRPIELLPILCGGFEGFILGDAKAESDDLLARFFTTLTQVVGARKVLFVAAADLAHVGPAFGGPALNGTGRADLKAADERLLAQITSGNAAGFLQEIRREQDAYNVCGTAPIYLLLRALAPAQGIVTAYDSCAADQQDTSCVTVCGAVLQ
jgi:hypothetical protein